jgi:hypothetical protein
MLTGLPPFYCEDVQQMYTKIMTAELQFPDYLSEEAKDLLKRVPHLQLFIDLLIYLFIYSFIHSEPLSSCFRSSFL